MFYVRYSPGKSFSLPAAEQSQKMKLNNCLTVVFCFVLSVFSVNAFAVLSPDQTEGGGFITIPVPVTYSAEHSMTIDDLNRVFLDGEQITSIDQYNAKVGPLAGILIAGVGGAAIGGIVVWTTGGNGVQIAYGALGGAFGGLLGFVSILPGGWAIFYGAVGIYGGSLMGYYSAYPPGSHYQCGTGQKCPTVK